MMIYPSLDHSSKELPKRIDAYICPSPLIYARAAHVTLVRRLQLIQSHLRRLRILLFPLFCLSTLSTASTAEPKNHLRDFLTFDGDYAITAQPPGHEWIYFQALPKKKADESPSSPMYAVPHHPSTSPLLAPPTHAQLFAPTQLVKRDGAIRRCGRVLIMHLQSVCGGCLKSHPDSEPIAMREKRLHIIKRSEKGRRVDETWRIFTQDWPTQRTLLRNKRGAGGVGKITEMCCTQRACSDEEIRPFCC